LSKILWKKPKKDSTKRRVNVRYNAEKDRLETDEPELDEEFDEEQEDEYDPNGSVMDNRQLRSLQRRLQDTEHTMHEILSQLEQLSSTADPTAAEQIKKMTLETLSNLGKLNTDRAAQSSRGGHGDLGFTGLNGNRGNGNLKFDSTEKRYLNDLQKALADFKTFTENYIEEHSPTQGPSPDANVNGDGKGSVEVNVGLDEPSGSNTEDGIDIMESEKTCSSEELKVEDGEGELIRLEEKKENVFQDRDENKEAEKGQENLNMRQEEEEKKGKKVRQRKGKKHVRSED